MNARPFCKLLIANRGEIACRIARTAHRLGLATVAVYSEADCDALHVAASHEAVCIGPAAAAESYLRIDRIIDAARATGADAIHPGYGFLSENADFATACAAAKIVFVGPSAASIRAMASKSAARTQMEKAGVPIVPGYHGDAQDDATLSAAARKIGFPVLIKPTAGGGGKGMRVVTQPNELEEALAGARREAARSFGDDRLLIEKYITRGRHIEVQVFGDTHGDIVSLFERDCTLQRRHQKVIEEAPSAVLSDERREALYTAACMAGRAIDYVGAGTVEFIADDTHHYFLEMNTRLQVEHPVTEMITGLDLVEWQLRVAAGEKLPLAQGDVVRDGHAIEARVYAEDPDRDLLPSSGRIVEWQTPVQSADVRIDTGFRAGDIITQHYDPLLAKLIVRAPNRAAALRKLDVALQEFVVSGIATNVSLLRELVQHRCVADANIDTGFIERYLADPGVRAVPDETDLVAACAAVLLRDQVQRPGSGSSPWRHTDGWMVAGTRRRHLAFLHRGKRLEATLVYQRDGLHLQRSDSPVPLKVAVRDGGFDFVHGEHKRRAKAVWSGREVVLSTDHGTFILHLVDPFAGDESALSSGHGLLAPMSGTVMRIVADPGSVIERGASILMIESMKMEHTMRAPSRGTLTSLACKVGDFVQQGAELGEFVNTSETQ